MKLRQLTVPFEAIFLSFVLSSCSAGRPYDPYYNRAYSYKYKYRHHHYHDYDHDHERNDGYYGYKRY